MSVFRHFRLNRVLFWLLFVGMALSLAHLLVPDYQWGQGRSSIFSMNHSLSLASWLAAMQFFLSGLFALIGMIRARWLGHSEKAFWGWFVVVLIGFGLSFFEFSRLYERVVFVGSVDLFDQLAQSGIGFLFLFPLMFFISYWRLVDGFSNRLLMLMATAFGGALLLGPIAWLMEPDVQMLLNGLAGLFHLWGGALLLVLVMRQTLVDGVVFGYRLRDGVQPGGEIRPVVAMAVIAGAAMSHSAVQILLFHIASVFHNYTIAQTIISVALLGLAVGGLIGYRLAGLDIRRLFVVSGTVTAISFLLALGVLASLADFPWLSALLLMPGFSAISVIMTVILIRHDAHVTYGSMLIGAALGAILIDPMLGLWQEEGALLALTLIPFGIAMLFVQKANFRPVVVWPMVVVMSVLFGVLCTVVIQSPHEALNITLNKYREKYPDLKILHSHSSTVGRYEIVKRTKKANSLKSKENGRTIDTIRDWPPENYQIDPRLPHTWKQQPKVLIIGLSGDGIAKTARERGGSVVGLEINPHVVDIQQNVLKRRNGNSYAGIDVRVADGWGFVRTDTGVYDMITLLNTHHSRGSLSGRAPSPENLYSIETIHHYLDRLSDDGLILIEHPTGSPQHEPVIWKMLTTMRQALLMRGAERPEDHFFIFMWRTRSNHYAQIVMNKTPITEPQLNKLNQWLRDVDEMKALEKAAEKRLGPIKAHTLVLHAPGQERPGIVSKAVRGLLPESLVEKRHLEPMTDDRPFLFDVLPDRAMITESMAVILVVALVLVALLWRSMERVLISHHVMVFLTGLAYLLIEVVLIQRGAFFLGAPAVVFAAILGGLLVFSGLGSVMGRWIGGDRPWWIVLVIIGLLMGYEWLSPGLFAWAGGWSLAEKTALLVASIAPLAFFMGMVFPFVLDHARINHVERSAGSLFAINAIGSALSVPITLFLTMVVGMTATFYLGVLAYLLVLLLLMGLFWVPLRGVGLAAAGLFIVMVIFSPWWSGPAVQSLVAQEATPAKVYALKYGESRVKQKTVYYNGSSRKRMKFAWWFWMVEMPDGRRILVDTGTDDKSRLNKWKVKNYTHPTELLARLDVAPQAITDIILTHLHWDHMGLISAYPDAQIWLQQKAWAHAESRFSDTNKSFLNGMDRQHWQQLQKRHERGLVSLMDGDQQMVPGLSVSLAESHTPGGQYVTIETQEGPLILAGDAIYLYRNSQHHRPSRSHGPEQGLDIIEKMQWQAASPYWIIPGHDPLVKKFFPEVADNIVALTPWP
ncbi:MAG: MBL fold metallo-hydrolase [Magnetococcales bacterium]|nr:MBL fold metallo-hydrolase [Magnetococcales bacterium]